MNNEQLPSQRILEIIKLLLALAPAGFLFAMFIYFLIEMFDWNANINFYFLSVVWTFLLFGFVNNRVEGVEDWNRWDRVTILWMCIFYGFLFTALSIFFLGILLQLTLNIDIQEFDRSIYLTVIVWTGWIIGIYFFHFKNQLKNKSNWLI